MYYSTNKQAPLASLEEAVVKGLAPDRGLYMPEHIRTIPADVIAQMKTMSFHEIAYIVAEAFFGEDIDANSLRSIVEDTLVFDTPVVELVNSKIYSLELYHGPTLAFKDVGGRFMARLLGYFLKKQRTTNEVHVLAATSGDTGSAVANGFLGVPGIHVHVLYPKGKVSTIQECQFTTLGQNITALEVDGTFDDCQALVKAAFMDTEINATLQLTSANSINIARFLPQSFYYFYAYAQMDRLGLTDQLVISVPSGNFGNITAGLFAHRMGLPIKRFIAANNRNDVFLEYLNTAIYTPRPSVETLANAMDVGDPSNFARIIELFSLNDSDPHSTLTELVSGYRYDDNAIANAMRNAYVEHAYTLDPHGACGYQALLDSPLSEGECGLFLETAHPAKFKDSVDRILNQSIAIPAPLQAFMAGIKQSKPLSSKFTDFKQYLLSL